jgi:two-component system OmpR family sensor kinase
LQIVDDGQGIPAELQSEIFKAFVTSKPAHQGTGLGLYMAQEMLSLIQGELTLLSSQPGHTVFSLQLPYDLKEDTA